ncbi:MAG: hypothetical protein RM347_032535 [Nostoc sp. ChiQUE02]|uniref:hypothetical protein n=1 Tax=Nostoc sp. ChiQUE02 TaxID=3075377 RepID=UPI002AD235FB|nr:hypothetical protein [Nostoc sp. ChiQUE02]
MRLQFDNKINPFPETSRLALTGDASSVAIAKKSLVVLYREIMHGSSSWGATAFVTGVPSVAASGVETPIKVDCLITTLAHRTRKFES